MTIPVDAINRLSLYNASNQDVPYTMVGPTGYGYVIQWVAAMSDLSVTLNWVADLTATLVVSPDGSAKGIRVLTQGEYDAIPVPDPSTLYAITG